MDIKHGGCFDCGSKDEAVLTSIRDPHGKAASSKAVCSKCLPKEYHGD